MPEDIKKEVASLIRNKELDWRRFMNLSELYRVAPFVYRHLQSFDEYIPEHVRAVLRVDAGAVFARNVAALGDLKLITEMFSDEGIEVLFIKGVPFMFDIYRETGLRSFSDIDILVKDFGKPEGILKGKGFTLHENRGFFNYYRSQRMYTLNKKIALDVHVDFIGRRLHNMMLNIDKKRIWENKREVCMDDVRIYTLDIVHTLLYSCLHLAVQHGFLGLIWYVDIHEFISRYRNEIDWNRILELTQDYKIQRPVYYSLLFAKNMLGTPIPGYVLEKLGRVERKLDHKVFDKIKANNTKTDYLAELAMFDSIWDTVKFVLLSFVVYPYLIVHFIKIFGKIFESLCVRDKERGRMNPTPTKM